MSVQTLEQEIMTKIAGLPEHRLRETLDFVSFLLLQEQRRSKKETKQDDAAEPNHDPLLRFVGKVSHGSLAQEIDPELYGI